MSNKNLVTFINFSNQCAGPYGHRLFNMMDEDNKFVKESRKLTDSGFHVFKLGWARVNFNYFISDEEVKFICDAIRQIGKHGWKLLPFYKIEPSGLFVHRDHLSSHDEGASNGNGMLKLTDLSLSLRSINRTKSGEISFPNDQAQRTSIEFHDVLEDADVIYKTAEMYLRKVMDRSDEYDTSLLADLYIEKLPSDLDMDMIWWATSDDLIKQGFSAGPVNMTC